MSKIPLLIHQVWIGKTPDEQPPVKYNRHRESIKKVNPDFKIKLWLGRDVDTLFDDNDLAKYKTFYDSIPYVICKADFARMMVVYKCGGVYMDLDFMAHRPLKELLNRYPQDSIFIREPPENRDGEIKLYNGCMASVAGSSFVLGYIEYMKQQLSEGRYLAINVLTKTGPIAFMNYARASGVDWEKFNIPTHLILPVDAKNNLTAESLKYPDDGAYVSTIWCEGTMWIVKVIEDVCLVFFGWYGLIVTVLILLLLLALWWSKRRC